MNMTPTNVTRIQDRTDFIGKVYTLLGISLLFCCGGALYGLSMPISLYFPMIIFEEGLGEGFVCTVCVPLLRGVEEW